MKLNRVRGYIVLAWIWIVFSVISFMVPFTRNIVFGLAYVFGIVAILYQIYVFELSVFGQEDRKSKIYGFPIARMGVLYLIAQLIVSILEMCTAAILPVWVPMIVNVILVALAMTGCMGTDAMRDEVIRQEEQIKKDVSNMKALQSFSASLVNQCADEAMKKTVQKLADEIRFSDPVSSDETRPLELHMQSQMRAIQDAVAKNDSESVNSLCGQMHNELAQRNRICALHK